MSAVVTMLLARLVCSDPPPTFREFYRDNYGMAAGWGRQGEATEYVIRRFLDAAADFQDYRAARLDRCGRSQ